VHTKIVRLTPSPKGRTLVLNAYESFRRRLDDGFLSPSSQRKERTCLPA